MKDTKQYLEGEDNDVTIQREQTIEKEGESRKKREEVCIQDTHCDIRTGESSVRIKAI